VKGPERGRRSLWLYASIGKCDEIADLLDDVRAH
jgi:hypothetical protein